MEPDTPRFAARLAVLVVADGCTGELLDNFLTSEGRDVALLADRAAVIERLRKSVFHLVVLDLETQKTAGDNLIREIRELDRDIEIIAISTAPPLQPAEVSIRRGVTEYVYRPTTEYISPPIVPSKIQEAIGRIARRRPLRSVPTNPPARLVNHG